MNRIESLSQCFIAEVTTNYGTGFIETIVHRDLQSTGSFFSGRVKPTRSCPTSRPPTSRNSRRASPTPSMPPVICAPARSLKTSWPHVVFSAGVGAFLETTGCLSFYVDATEDAASFKVVVAELPNDTDVESLASGASAMIKRCVFDESRPYSSWHRPTSKRR